MTMTSTDAWVGGALRRVSNAVTIEQLHGPQSFALKTVTRTNVEDAIREALGFGFSRDAVADAASMTVTEVDAIGKGPVKT